MRPALGNGNASPHSSEMLLNKIPILYEVILLDMDATTGNY